MRLLASRQEIASPSGNASRRCWVHLFLHCLDRSVSREGCGGNNTHGIPAFDQWEKLKGLWKQGVGEEEGEGGAASIVSSSVVRKFDRTAASFTCFLTLSFFMISSCLGGKKRRRGREGYVWRAIGSMFRRHRKSVRRLKQPWREMPLFYRFLLCLLRVT